LSQLRDGSRSSILIRNDIHVDSYSELRS